MQSVRVQVDTCLAMGTAFFGLPSQAAQPRIAEVPNGSALV
ncbi:hypothetical protein [Synechococcus sp. MIT S9220]